MQTERKPKANQGPLTEDEKSALVQAHECDTPAWVLADEYGISVRSVAAYVANAHR